MWGQKAGASSRLEQLGTPWVGALTYNIQQLGLEQLYVRWTRIGTTFAQDTATNWRHMDMSTPVTSARRLGTYGEIISRTDTYDKLALPYLTSLLNQCTMQKKVNLIFNFQGEPLMEKFIF